MYIMCLRTVYTIHATPRKNKAYVAEYALMNACTTELIKRRSSYVALFKKYFLPPEQTQRSLFISGAFEHTFPKLWCVKSTQKHATSLMLSAGALPPDRAELRTPDRLQ